MYTLHIAQCNCISLDHSVTVLLFTADYPNLDQLRIAKKDKELRENILKSAKQNYSPMEVCCYLCLCASLVFE